jgi:hypothetical protein
MTVPRTSSTSNSVSAAVARHPDVVARRALLAGVASFVLTALALASGLVLPAVAAENILSTVGVVNLVAIAFGVAGLRGARGDEPHRSPHVAVNTLAAVAGLVCGIVAFVAVLIARLAV